MSELSNIRRGRSGEAGFTLVQMAVAMAIIFVVVTLGYMSITRAKSDLAMSGEIRRFSAYLEKGRIEAVRRRTNVTVITINSDSSYTATLDSNYDGTLSASESNTVTLPTGLTFNSANITYPATITFNLQGRSSMTNVTGSTITMSNTYGTSNTVTMTGGGDVTLESTITGPAANTNLAPTTTVASTANIKALN